MRRRVVSRRGKPGEGIGGRGVTGYVMTRRVSKWQSEQSSQQKRLLRTVCGDTLVFIGLATLKQNKH